MLHILALSWPLASLHSLAIFSAAHDQVDSILPYGLQNLTDSPERVSHDCGGPNLNSGACTSLITLNNRTNELTDFGAEEAGRLPPDVPPLPLALPPLPPALPPALPRPRFPRLVPALFGADLEPLVGLRGAEVAFFAFPLAAPRSAGTEFRVLALALGFKLIGFTLLGLNTA